MKKLKRGISLLLCVLMLASCFSVAAPTAFAEGCEHEFSAHVVAPTCAQGYTLYTCVKCDYSYRDNYVPAVDEHDFSIVLQVVAPTCTAEGYSYKKCSVCGEEKALDFVAKTEHNYTVFEYTCYDTVNDYYTQKKTCADCGHFEVNQPFVPVYLYKTVKIDGTEQNTLFETAYAPLGGTALYDETPTLTRQENDNFAKWQFSGWDRADGLDNITGTTSVLALFEGIDVYYDVSFYDRKNNKVLTQKVLYNHAAAVPENFPMEYKNEHAIYTFNRWNKDFSHVTSNMSIEAIYDTEWDKVTVYFNDYNGNLIDEPVVCDYGTSLSVFAPSAERVFRPADDTYVYEFTGKWKDSAGRTWTKATAEGLVLNLRPDYYSEKIKYDVVLRIFDGDIGAPYATYQVISTTYGNLVDSGTTNEAGQAVLKLANDTYIVKVASSDRLKAGDATFAINPGSGFVDHVNVVLVNNDQYYDDGTVRCSCPCHSILGPLWVKILNLLYSLFNIRYVCCNDMFAAHAGELKYTAGN